MMQFQKCMLVKRMPINVFRKSSSSHDNSKKIDTSLFVQEPRLKTIFIESNNEQYIDIKIRIELKI